MAGEPHFRTPDDEGGWVKSTYSSGSGECVEIKHTATLIAVRDSKNPAAGHLSFLHPAWTTFLPRRPVG
ncbi:DUF397 domain-containing protein [Actinokineospora sp.]|uniref:DUF397 domain-containing protein n=1 Tax=Actinokineospora sp. TaxID=1872133 RepID=UPI0040376CB6